MDDRTLARFMTKVEKQTEVTSPHVDTPCWLWTAASHPRGYGTLTIGSRTDGSRRHARAHHLSFEHWHGPRAGRCILHRCDTPACVNPRHLRAGTQADNVRDMERKGRGRKPGQRGESNGSAKLSAHKVREIRRRAGGGESHETLASEFGVSPGAVRFVVLRKTWRHVQ